MYVINDKRIGIDIQIEEGDKFYIRNVSWVGNSQYSTELLQAMLGIEKGRYLRQKDAPQTAWHRP